MIAFDSGFKTMQLKFGDDSIDAVFYGELIFPS